MTGWQSFTPRNKGRGSSVKSSANSGQTNSKRMTLKAIKSGTSRFLSLDQDDSKIQGKFAHLDHHHGHHHQHHSVDDSGPLITKLGAFLL